MNDLQIFNNAEFGRIRILEINGEPWFVGNDIAASLGYSVPKDAVYQHVDEEDKLGRQITASGQKRTMVVINESGLYSLILSSKLENAKKFKRWVTSEVLPSIRKTGGYQIPQTYAEALRALADKTEEAENMAREMIAMNDKIEEMQPKITYLDLILESKDTMTVTQIAQDYGISAQALNNRLHELGIQHKVNGQWVLYSQYLGQGYTHSHTHKFTHRDGSTGTNPNTEWTQKGRLFLYEKLKDNGILPDIEK